MFRTLRLQLVVVISLGFFTGCGSSSGGSGGGSEPVLESIEVMPGLVGVSIDDDGQQFFAVAKDPSGSPINGQNFTWSIIDDNGNKGSIDQSGFYRPPDLLPNSNVVEVKATSTSDPSKSDTASVNLLTGAQLSFAENKFMDSHSTGNELSALGSQSIAVKGDLVFAAWADLAGSEHDLHIVISRDRGSTFCHVTWMLENDQQTPSVALDSEGNVYIAWSDLSQFGNWNVSFARVPLQEQDCTSLGQKINEISVQHVTFSDTSTNQLPGIAVDSSDNVYIAWFYQQEGSQSGIYFIKGTRNTDGTISFGSSTLIDSGTQFFIEPDIAVDESGNIIVAWADNRGGDTSFAVYMARCLGSGACEKPVKVSGNNVVFPLSPSVAVDPFGEIYVAWTGFNNSNTSIYMAKITNSGQILDPKIISGDSTADQQWPSLSIDLGGHIYIAWEDYRNNDTNPDIYFAKSMNGGASFEEQSVIRGDTTNAAQYSPSLSLDSAGRAFLMWFDERDTTPSLYHTVGQ